MKSNRLAEYVQNTVCDHLKTKYSSIRNKGVKKAPFYVLLGAQMPAILLETSFISNSRECKRLVSGTFQGRNGRGHREGHQTVYPRYQPHRLAMERTLCRRKKDNLEIGEKKS